MCNICVKHLGNPKRHETTLNLFREKPNTINSKRCYLKDPRETSRKMGAFQAVGLVRKGSEGGVIGPIQGTAWLEQSHHAGENVSPALGGILNLSRRQSCCPLAKLPHGL